MAARPEIIGGTSFAYVLQFPCGLLLGITALGLAAVIGAAAPRPVEPLAF